MDAFELLRAGWTEGEPALLLDGASAAAGPEAVRRFSYLALRPAAGVCVRGDEAWWGEPDARGRMEWARVEEDAWALLRRLRVEGPRVEGVPFPHGIAGLASYDAGRLIERLPARAVSDTEVPWLLFYRFDAVWAQPAGRAPVLHVRPGGEAAGDALRAIADRRASHAAGASIGPVRSEMDPKAFEEIVVRAKAHIRAGDVFQVNLSHRLACDVAGSPLALYERLREVNPAPFGAFFASGPLPWDDAGCSVLSASPERLFRLAEGRLEARPIAGTRRRDADPERDEALRAELPLDPKERAEHIMLVDLARNDLGRVARFGSVRVPEMLSVESYRTVHHLVSIVEAELAAGRDAVDALVALFPGGTITGAPKVRAMELIEELEPVRRGVYTGSIGWISSAGDADLNILIRTILLQHRAGAPARAHLQVGAGIVEDSDPRREYEETLAKAKGLLLALGQDAP